MISLSVALILSRWPMQLFLWLVLVHLRGILRALIVGPRRVSIVILIRIIWILIRSFPLLPHCIKMSTLAWVEVHIVIKARAKGWIFLLRVRLLVV